MPADDRKQVPRDEATPGRFAVEHAHHEMTFFGDWVEVAYPPGEDNEPGPTTLWMRTPPLLKVKYLRRFRGFVHWRIAATASQETPS